ncbi:ABC transporter ATP-binding protein [Acidocella aminolytica]|uniref:ABC transporter lipoprotein releasing system LolD n=1 Tax=Acidocella aminolytica 101 = DSM 11237 TaxID=1120923 RepID=A0A0D6PED8_9PROT|nr:ABC transporter ATP-binding protein [Acidocella aminolytica]GAN79706.1 ABC transporter lipoprotein releasing system LolD [Acidocella aminolytica 101 = DSM 11237]GBQ39798.1 lipoprotein releasing system ATP-binding protein LolD [Acidocella aminolytica 101 = DSM 11237]SHE73663.1 lipoprotein-releasing system ATP-binding protein [Acidocella aminolytica 101 = DSM 11237]
MSEYLLSLKAICRTYQSGEGALTVLNGAALTLAPGEIVALVAPSGSGKSTLLHLAGLLEKPDAGSVIINGQNAGDLNDTGRTALRLKHVGFVYQFHHLLAEFTALENISVPQMIAGVPQSRANQRSLELLEKFGLGPRASHLPGKLSGGEKQRVAIARALANNPSLLLADEPTGNLDVATANIVFEELLHVVRSENTAALIATHNPDLAARMDRQITLRDGRLV